LYSFQGIGWGLTSEMISVAERLRWWISPTPLSPLRLTLAAILTILTTLTLPQYSAKLMFLPLLTQNTPQTYNISTNIHNPHSTTITTTTTFTSTSTTSDILSPPSSSYNNPNTNNILHNNNNFVQSSNLDQSNLLYNSYIGMYKRSPSYLLFHKNI
jgi:hypothetical protein